MRNVQTCLESIEIFSPTAAPDPAGELTTLPDPLVGLEGKPSPLRSAPVSALDVSIVGASGYCTRRLECLVTPYPP